MYYKYETPSIINTVYEINELIHKFLLRHMSKSEIFGPVKKKTSQRRKKMF